MRRTEAQTASVLHLGSGARTRLSRTHIVPMSLGRPGNLGPPDCELRSRGGGLGHHFCAREAARCAAMLACPDVSDGKTENDMPIATKCHMGTSPGRDTLRLRLAALVADRSGAEKDVLAPQPSSVESRR